jgi:hypothetical protein
MIRLALALAALLGTGCGLRCADASKVAIAFSGSVPEYTATLCWPDAASSWSAPAA